MLSRLILLALNIQCAEGEIPVGWVFCVLWYAKLICRTDLLLNVCLMMGGGAQKQQPFSPQFLPQLFYLIVFLHFFNRRLCSSNGIEDGDIYIYITEVPMQLPL